MSQDMEAVREQFRVQDLRRLARNRGLSTNGNKETLIERLIAAGHEFDVW